MLLPPKLPIAIAGLHSFLPHLCKLTEDKLQPLLCGQQQRAPFEQRAWKHTTTFTFALQCDTCFCSLSAWKGAHILTQLFVVLDGGCVFSVGGVVKVSHNHCILPRLAGDVIHDVAVEFLGRHAEDAHLQH